MLLIYIIIGMLSSGVTGYFIYRDKVNFWKAEAFDAFTRALVEELQSREGMEIYFASSGTIGFPVDSIERKKEPIKVSMRSEYGKKDFLIPYEKYSRNIESHSDMRGLHSSVLKVYPLVPDSLNIRWINLLEKIGFTGKTAVGISVTDWWEHETSTYSSDSIYVKKADHSRTYTLGYRSEVEVTGYIYYSWWMALTLIDKVLLGAIVFGCVLLFLIQEYIVRLYRYFFIKEVPVVIEKEIPVVEVGKVQAHIYKLEEDLFYDADSGILKRGEYLVRLTAKPAKLLQELLDAEEHRLSMEEIIQSLWPDNVGTAERVHSTVRRLRKNLSEISGWVIENRNCGYQLKSPHSIEENQKE